MDAYQPRGKRPEDEIQTDIIKMLRFEGWYVKRIPGSTTLSGFPDLFTCHSKYGIRLIEVKRPHMEGSKFTPAQLEDFPKFVANGAGVWILTGDSKFEYDKLFAGCNWYQYL